MNKFLGIALALLMVVSALTVITTVSATKYVDSDITTDTTWSESDNPIYITTDITIDEDVTLTIKPGTNIYVDKGVTIKVDGTLLAQGSHGKRINITANNTSPNRAFWRSIYFGPTATGCTLDYCNISYADIALDVWSRNKINITRCNLTYNGEAAVEGHYADLYIHGCNVTDNYNWTGSGSWVAVNSFGIGCFNGTKALITNNYIANNYDPTDQWTSWFYGIFVTESSLAYCYNNTLERNNNTDMMYNYSYPGAGIAATRNGFVEAIDNTVVHSYAGFYSDSFGVINATRNLAKFDDNGFYLSYGNCSVKDNKIIACLYGFYGWDLNGTLKNNDILYSSYTGVTLYQNSYYLFVNLEKNRITHTSDDQMWTSIWNPGVYISSWWMDNPNKVVLLENNISYNNNTGVYVEGPVTCHMSKNLITNNTWNQNLTSSWPTNIPPGLYVSGAANVKSEGDVYSDNSVNVFSDWGASPKVFNSSLKDSRVYDAILESSMLQLINTSVDFPEVYYADTSSELQICDSIVVNVTLSGKGVAGANIKVMDKNNRTVSSGISDAKGNAYGIFFVNMSIIDRNGDTIGNATLESKTFNPHNVSALQMTQKLFGFNVTTLKRGATVKIKMADMSSLWIFWPNGHVVSGSESYTGKTIICGGDIYVPAGTSLDFDSVDLGMLCDSEGEHIIQVNETGYFNLTKTTISKIGAGGYNFLLAGNSTSGNGANMGMDHCNIFDLSSSGIAMISSNGIRISNTTIKSALSESIIIMDSSPIVEYNLITLGDIGNNKGAGIYITGQSAPVIDHNNISLVGAFGIYSEAWLTPSIQYNTIHDVESYGIYSTGPINIFHNIIHDCSEGIYIDFATADIQNNTVYRCQYGIDVYYSQNSVIAYNYVHHNMYYGISVYEGTYIHHNKITENGIDDGWGGWANMGLYVSYESTAPIIEYNNISSNPYAGAYISSWSMMGSVGGTIFQHNTVSNNGYAVVNFSYVYCGLEIYATPVYFNNNTFVGNYMGLYYQADIWSGVFPGVVYNSTIVNSTNYDIVAMDWDVLAVNTTTDLPYAEIQSGTSASILQMNYVDALVKKNGAGQSGATVKNYDGASLKETMTTDANGWVYGMKVVYRSAVATTGTAAMFWTYNTSVVSAQYTNFLQSQNANASTHKVLVFENQPPYQKALIPSTYAMPEDTVQTNLIDLSKYFTFDRNVTAAHTFTVTYNSQSSIIDMKMNPDKRNLTVDALTGTANDDWSGLVDVKVTASDSVAPPIESNQFTINITPLNDAPVWGVLPNLNLIEDVNDSQAMDLAPYVTDVDDPGSAIVFSVQSYTNNQFMELYTNTHYLGIRSKAGVDNFYGSILATLNASDGKGASMTTLTILITGTNDGPFVNHTIGTVTFAEDTIDTTIDLSYIFADPEKDLLTYGDIANPNLTASINNMGHVALASSPNWNGEDYITFFANDSEEEAMFTVHVVVTPVNDVPALSPINPLSFNEGAWKEIALTATDADNEPLTFSTNTTNRISGLVEGVNYAFNVSSGVLRILPDDPQVGDYNVTFTVKDGSEASTTIKVRIRINNVNEAPMGVTILSPEDNAVYEEGAAIDLLGTAMDPDLDLKWSQEVLSYKWETNLSTTALGYGKTLNDMTSLPKGVNKITLTVSDKAGLTATASINVTITGEGGENETDTDGDGLPDAWEMKYFHNLTYGPSDDPDKDGYTNLQEYNGGTDPTNPNDPAKPDDDDDDTADDKGLLDYWWIMLIIVLVVLILVVVAVFLVRSRKKAQEEPAATPTPMPMPAPPSPTVAQPMAYYAPPPQPVIPGPETVLPGTVPQQTMTIAQPEVPQLPPANFATAPGPEATAPQNAMPLEDAPVDEVDPLADLGDLGDLPEDPATDGQPKTDIKSWDIKQ